MNSENQTDVRYKQPIKIEKPLECSRRFLAALVKKRWRHFHAQIMAENAVNKEENLNSQSSQIEEEDLQKLEADSVLSKHQKPVCSSFMAGGEMHAS